MRGLSTSPPNPIIPLYELSSRPPYRDSPSTPSSPFSRPQEPHTPQATSRHLRRDSPASHSSIASRSSQPYNSALGTPLFSQPATASEDELLALARQTAHISKNLQTLLDAQSQGLLAGLSDVSSKRSPTPKISLHAARLRIPQTLLSLSETKTQETAILSASLSTLNAHLNSLIKHETRREALSQRIASMSSDPKNGTPIVERLQAQETELSHEIQELEDRLANLRAKQRHLKGEIELKTNHLDANLSSYKTALEDVDKDIHSRFLRTDPLSPASSTPPQGILSFSHVFPLSKLSDPSFKENQNVWTLPLSRRALPLVRVNLETRITGLTQRLQASDLEAHASAEGAQLWTSVLETLERTEQVIRETMSRQQEVLDRADLDEERRKAVLEGDTRALIRLVEDALGGLRHAEELARGREWKFLVCAIGAEAEALLRGREVLFRLLAEETGESNDRKQVLGGKEEVEKAQSVQDIRNERKTEDDRPSSAGTGSGRMQKTHGRQSSFPIFSWSRKASAVEPKLTRNDAAQREGSGVDRDVDMQRNGLVERESSLLDELNGGEAAQGDDDELLRDLINGGQ